MDLSWGEADVSERDDLGLRRDTVSHEERTLEKISLALFFTAISGLALLYHDIYPLYLGFDSGFLSQIPLIFWPVITLAILSGVSYALLSASAVGISTSIAVVFLIINFKQYLFFSFTGGDSGGEIARWYSIQNSPRLSVELFTYFQWPFHFTFFEVYNIILDLPLIDMLRLSYVSLYFLFIVAVFYFFYRYTSGTTYWVASSVYVIYMMMFLNNQLVPQFFALVTLLFLLGFGTSNTLKSSSIQIFLFFVLVWSHPFFFALYLITMAVHPFISSVRTQLSKHGEPHAPVYFSLWKTLLAPRDAIGGVVWGGFNNLLNNFLPRLLIMTAIYLASLEYRFPNFRETFSDELAGSISRGGSGSLLARLNEIFFSGESTAVNEQPVTLLYQLSSESLHTLTIFMILGIFVSLLLTSVIQFFRMDTEDLPLVPISAGVVGAVYYVGGFFYPIIGTRAYQLALLPLGAFIFGRNIDGKVVKAIVLIALVASPVFGVNAMINASITGGGNTQNQYAHEAGQHLAQYDGENGENILKYPRSGLPPELTYEQNQRIITLDELILREEAIQRQFRDPSVIVYGPRQVHTAAHYRVGCNFEPSNRNIIYDNNVTILSNSNSISGIECVGME